MKASGLFLLIWSKTVDELKDELHAVRVVSYLSGGEASVIVLLPSQPPDNTRGISQILSSRGGAEFGQQHIRTDLH